MTKSKISVKVSKDMFDMISFKEFINKKPIPIKFDGKPTKQEKISALIRYEAKTDERKLHVLRDDRLWKIVNESSNRALYRSKEKRYTIKKAEQFLISGRYKAVIIHTIDGEPKECILPKGAKVSEIFQVK